MYTRHDVAVARPASSVRDALLADPEHWLPETATRFGPERYAMRVGIGAWACVISTELELTLRPPESIGDWLVIPLSCRTVAAGRAIPLLDGRLTLQPRGPESSVLWLGGTYEVVPAGRDFTGGQRIARETVRAIVEGVAGRLLAPV
jgi:hypothetical protein